MYARISLLLAIGCLGLNAWAIAQEKADPVPLPGVEAIVNAYAEYDIVGLGEVHQLEQYFEFVTQLVQAPAFQEQVQDIVIEFGNALYQPALDRYIAGEEIPLESLQRLWRNHTESPTGPWDAPVYFDLLKTIREVNKALPAEKQFRVVAADPPIDWEAVQTREDFNQYRGRSLHMGQVVVREVLDKKRKGLLVIGGAHLGRMAFSPTGRARANVTTTIESAYPGSILPMVAVAGFGPRTKDVEPRIAHWPIGSIAFLKDTWLGALPVPIIMNTQTGETLDHPLKGKTRADLVDAYLYLGPRSSLQWSKPSAEVYADEAYWKELNRRSLIRYGRPLDPESRTKRAPRPVAE